MRVCSHEVSVSMCFEKGPSRHFIGPIDAGIYVVWPNLVARSRMLDGDERTDGREKWTQPVRLPSSTLTLKLI